MVHNTNIAKNILLFIGDGMSVPTLTASRILKGQLKGKTGEEGQLYFETFPHVGVSKVSLQVTPIFKCAEFYTMKPIIWMKVNLR